MICLRLVLTLCFALAALWAAGGAQAEPPAKELFGAKVLPAAMAPRAIGSYAKGCLAGAAMLPVNGPAWQAMRLSRNRNWAHPDMVRLVERLAIDAKEKDGWPGLLVGDLAQPRGGPMVSGHASHQIGLDADIWLTPMPDHTLTVKEREEISAVSMLKDNSSVDPNIWTEAHVKLLKRAASYQEVERIFVHPAIKKALCEAAGEDRAWLEKIRPWWGHYYHFHVRIACPQDNADCSEQPDPPDGDGCGKPLEEWLAKFRQAPPPTPAKPRKPRPALSMASLPKACRAVLEAPPPAQVTVAAAVAPSGETKLPWLKPSTLAAPLPSPAPAVASVPLPERKPRPR